MLAYSAKVSNTDVSLSHRASFGVDQSSNELDIVWVDGSTNDIFWGEATLWGLEQTALASKFIGTFGAVAAISDSTDDLQVAAVDNAAVPIALNYARLSSDGVSEQAPTAKFSDSTNADTIPDLAVLGNDLYWTWKRGNFDIYFGRTSLTGTILSATTGTRISTESDRPENVNIGVGADYWSRLMWVTPGITGTRFALVDMNGAVVSGPKTLFGKTYHPLGIIVDDSGDAHVFMLDHFTTKGQNIVYARISATGGIRVAPAVIFGGNNIYPMTGAVVRSDSRSDDAYILYKDVNDNRLYIAKFGRALGEIRP